LKADADIEAKDSGGCTSLHYAFTDGHPSVVQALLKAGANIEAKEGEYGNTSLHEASARVHPAVVQTLLERGSDVAAGNNNGKTALEGADACNDEVQKEEVKTVIARHSLLLAAQAGKADFVAEHIAQGADLAVRDKYGKTPFDYAKNDEVKTVFARHSLQAAAQFGKEELVAEHIASGADLAARDGCGRTALLLACANAHEPAAARLVAATKAVGSLDAVLIYGFSALKWAEERGLDGVPRLRECGAAAVRRPALALFRGKAGAVQVAVKELTVVFAGSFATVRSAQRCPLGGQGLLQDGDLRNR
jgi:hypothetical protein